QGGATQADPVEVDRRLGGEEEALHAGVAAGEDVAAIRADQPVGGGVEIDPPDPPVDAVAEIDDVVIAGAQVSEQGRPHREAVIVDLDLAALAIHIVGDACQAGQADEGEILASITYNMN